MRELTAGELDSWYRKGKWPCCGGDQYLRGPSGGLSVNVICPKCDTRMNVLEPEAGIRFGSTNLSGLGQMIREPVGYVAPPNPPEPKFSGARRLLTRLRELL